MRFQNFYQFSLIFLAFLVVFGVGVFVYKELFPEYKIYQYTYKDVEKFRSSYTGEKPAPFTMGIKQILIPDEKNGPDVIDRCISCHVALDLPHFSPVRVAHDVNDNPIYDAEGQPVLEENPDYVWERVSLRIAELRHPDFLAHYGNRAARLSEADFLEGLMTKKVDGRQVDMTKVLRMHPLIGSEIRPFQYHPMEEYGCTSCHSGNGRALVAKRAHGPVYDEEYEPAYESEKPQFTEKDKENEPKFARMYNNKPGHELAFQTTPILAGDLIVAKCVRCHQSASEEVKSSLNKLSYFAEEKKRQIQRIEESLENEKKALVSLLTLENALYKRGREGTVDWLNQQLGNSQLSTSEIDALEGQLAYINREEEPESAIRKDVEHIVGSQEAAEQLMLQSREHEKISQLVENFLGSHEQGSLKLKTDSLNKEKEILSRFQQASSHPVSIVKGDPSLLKKMGTEVDRLIAPYYRGKELFISQACYACHRIAGFSRASVGPELTHAGLNYPWFIKESIVWPQADLPSSTMPNFRLDHEELSDLMTFLMAQRGDTKVISEVDYQISLQDWEAGAKMPWEEPVPPTAIQNVREGMRVFVSEGCASCHKLEGFESNVGFAKGDTLQERVWFYRLFPEQISGSQLAKSVEENREQIEARIVDKADKKGIIEEIERDFPGLVEGFYTNFKYASRAMNSVYLDQPEKLAEYKERLRKVMMIYIQVYGMGRDIAPHLNWTGVYRDDEWLLGHFHNPTAYTARSLMPVMPFDDTKFYMLNHMLHALGQKNRDALREIWRKQGFNPPLAFELLCSSCHGANRQGHGVISEWIYPIPKNLRNPIFLKNLTKERAIDSILHGVRGTPMPPWGETALARDPIPVLTYSEASQLVDWLYQGLPEQPREMTQEDFKKWSYSPEDVVKEMKNEHDYLLPRPPEGATLPELAKDYFKEDPNPVPGPDKALYYIREKYYTDQNLQEAQKYFVVNCAPCHGKEGGGTGLRATSMVEAKPRMLTNLPWLRTRDDLRLLRSIKYGVPGTSMIPWGDQTTSAQRMQLVMYIRELTKQQIFSDELQDVLYEAFDAGVLEIEKARVDAYSNMEKLETELKKIQENLYEDADLSPEQAGKLYVQQKELKKEWESSKALDSLYKRLIELEKEQKEIFHGIGKQMISTKLSRKYIEAYFQVIHEDSLDFTYDLGRLEVKENTSTQAYEFLVEGLEEKIARYEKEIKMEERKIHSPERGRVIQELMDEQGTYINLKTKLTVQLADIKKLRIEQRNIYDKLFSL